jgi:hypothetical protein
MYALVHEGQKITETDGTILGGLVVQIEDETFEVAEPLTWYKIDKHVRPGLHYWDGEKAQVIPSHLLPQKARVNMGVNAQPGKKGPAVL